jgi:hypothetical protein
MPTLLRSGPYRLFFYGGDRPEPPHVHVRRDAAEAKIWLSPVTLAWASGYAPVELRRILALVQAHHEQLAEAWDAFYRR